MEARKVLAQLSLGEEEIRVDWQAGYPSGYAKLCRYAAVQMRGLITPFTEGPPQCFLPYAPSPEQIVRLKEFEKLFPIIPEEARDSHNARRHADILWQQLDHLGNAGFDPDLFRVDKFGNVIYLNADPASPLAWEVDHWFPHSRGGKNVASNLQIVQWQVNQRKKERLEFAIPWWDLQLGVSVNQFLYAFTSKHLEFRNRCFSFYFHGEAQKQLGELLIMQGHSWPQHFREKKTQIGLAAAALALVKEPIDESKGISGGRLKIPTSAGTQSGTPARRRWSLEEEEALRRALQKFGPGNWKEIKECEPALVKRSTVQIKDKYRLMKTDWSLGKENIGNGSEGAMALQRAIEVNLMQEEKKSERDAEIAQLEEHLRRLRMGNEKQTQTLEGLEGQLKECREQVEKQRQWAETQTSYRLCLERMIRDAIHQSGVYLEQAKLNQAACNALAAQLEARITSCEAAEAELIKTYREREVLEAVAYPRSESNSFTGQELVEPSLDLPEIQADESADACLKLLQIRGVENWVDRKSWQDNPQNCYVLKTTIEPMEDLDGLMSLDMKVKEEVGIDLEASQHRKLWRRISGRSISLQRDTEEGLGSQHSENKSHLRIRLDAAVPQAIEVAAKDLFLEGNPCIKVNKKDGDLVEQEGKARIEAMEKQQGEQFISDNRVIQQDQSELEQFGDGISAIHQHLAEDNQFRREEQNILKSKEIKIFRKAPYADRDELPRRCSAAVYADICEIAKADNVGPAELALKGPFQKLLVMEDNPEGKQGQDLDSEEGYSCIKVHKKEDDLVKQEDRGSIELMEKQQAGQFISANRIIQQDQSELAHVGDGISAVHQHLAADNRFGREGQKNLNGKEIRISMETQLPERYEILQQHSAAQNTDICGITEAENVGPAELALKGAFQKLLVMEDSGEDKQGQGLDSKEEYSCIKVNKKEDLVKQEDRAEVEAMAKQQIEQFMSDTRILQQNQNELKQFGDSISTTCQHLAEDNKFGGEDSAEGKQGQGLDKKEEYSCIKVNKKEDDLAKQEEDMASIEAMEKQQVEQFISDNKIIQQNQNGLRQFGDDVSTTHQHVSEDDQSRREEQNNLNNREIGIPMEAEQVDGDEFLQKCASAVNMDLCEVSAANNAGTAELSLEGAFWKLLLMEDSAEGKRGQELDSEEEEAANQIEKHHVDEDFCMPMSKKAGTEDDDSPLEYNSDTQQIQSRESNSDSQKPKGILQELLSRWGAKQQKQFESCAKNELPKERGHLRSMDAEALDILDPEISEKPDDADANAPGAPMEPSSSFQNSSSLDASHFRSMSSISHSRLDEEDNNLTRSVSSRYSREVNARQQQVKPGIKASIRAYTQAWIRTVKKLEARIQESQ